MLPFTFEAKTPVELYTGVKYAGKSYLSAFIEPGSSTIKLRDAAGNITVVPLHEAWAIHVPEGATGRYQLHGPFVTWDTASDYAKSRWETPGHPFAIAPLYAPSVGQLGSP